MVISADPIKLTLGLVFIEFILETDIQLSGILFGFNDIDVTSYFISRVDFKGRLNVEDCLLPVSYFLVRRS
jgi:hypothetical protein